MKIDIVQTEVLTLFFEDYFALIITKEKIKKKNNIDYNVIIGVYMVVDEEFIDIDIEHIKDVKVKDKMLYLTEIIYRLIKEKRPFEEIKEFLIDKDLNLLDEKTTVWT